MWREEAQWRFESVVMVYVVMAYIAKAYMVMAYIVMAYIVMAYPSPTRMRPRVSAVPLEFVNMMHPVIWLVLNLSQISCHEAGAVT